MIATHRWAPDQQRTARALRCIRGTAVSFLARKPRETAFLSGLSRRGHRSFTIPHYGERR